jgi:hypothetical protein
MTRDEILRLAKQSGNGKVRDPLNTHMFFYDELKRFAALVASAEREACAKVVENYAGAWDDQGYALSQAIRARGQA